MNTIKTAIISLFLVVSGAASAQAFSWTNLFNGSNTDSWVPVGNANWRIEDNALVADGGESGFMVSKESYADFVMTFEYWVDEPANSGVFIRCADAVEIGTANCYEVNIFDQRGDPTYRTGGIVNVAPILAHIDSPGRWNSYEIRAVGSHLEARVNGILTADGYDRSFANGPIGLQYGQGIVKFRNINIKPL